MDKDEGRGTRSCRPQQRYQERETDVIYLYGVKYTSPNRNDATWSGEGFTRWNVHVWRRLLIRTLPLSASAQIIRPRAYSSAHRLQFFADKRSKTTVSALALEQGAVGWVPTLLLDLGREQASVKRSMHNPYHTVGSGDRRAAFASHYPIARRGCDAPRLAHDRPGDE